MLEDLSVQEILNNIKDRKFSIREVVEFYLDRIDKYNPQLNAIILQKDRELIIKEAISKDNLVLVLGSQNIETIFLSGKRFSFL